jgi:hypothetical protein
MHVLSAASSVHNGVVCVEAHLRDWGEHVRRVACCGCCARKHGGHECSHFMLRPCHTKCDQSPPTMHVNDVCGIRGMVGTHWRTLHWLMQHCQFSTSCLLGPQFDLYMTLWDAVTLQNPCSTALSTFRGYMSCKPCTTNTQPFLANPLMRSPVMLLTPGMR